MIPRRCRVRESQLKPGNGNSSRSTSTLLSQHRAATTRRAAAAGKATLSGGSVSLLQDHGIVVGQLLTRLDVPDGLDPDPAVLDDRVAVGIARVVDPTGVVAVDGGIDDDIVVDRE